MNEKKLLKADWRKEAHTLFFVEHLSVRTIAEVVNRKRETVSRYINECDGYGKEMAFRQNQSKERRKQYRSEWDKKNRPERYRCISGETLRKEHEDAVRELSREKYY